MRRRAPVPAASSIAIFSCRSSFRSRSEKHRGTASLFGGHRARPSLAGGAPAQMCGRLGVVRGFEADDEAGAVPELDVVAIHQLLGLLDRVSIAVAGDDNGCAHYV